MLITYILAKIAHRGLIVPITNVLQYPVSSYFDLVSPGWWQEVNFNWCQILQKQLQYNLIETWLKCVRLIKWSALSCYLIDLLLTVYWPIPRQGLMYYWLWPVQDWCYLTSSQWRLIIYTITIWLIYCPSPVHKVHTQLNFVPGPHVVVPSHLVYQL